MAEHSALPPRVVVVDKKEQVLTLLEFQSSLESTTTYLCSTGQTPGDKVTEGDLKTPEGVYFVVQHLTSGLDFEMYGYEAYTLNYPNPVDKIRKKTGYGIWLHGKGNGIAPLQTQGCVALNNNDLNTLGKKLTPGMPVIISNSINMHTSSDIKADSIKKLQSLSQEWASAWGNRSASMFGYYDDIAYSLANEPFDAFKKNKERLFKRLPWIKTTIRDIQVLEGPGYWVTWFYQDYQAPNMTSKGVRRLYWSNNADGNFKIIGMEWLPGLNTSAQLAKEDPATPAVETSPKTEAIPEKFETIVAEMDSSGETQQQLQPAPSPKRATEQAPPKSLMIQSTLGGVIGAAHSKTPVPATSTPVANSPEGQQAKTQRAGTSDQQKQQSLAALNQNAPEPVDARQPVSTGISDQAVLGLIENWRTAWLKGDLPAYLRCYAKDARQGNRKGKESIGAHKKSLWQRAHPQVVELTNISIKREGSTIVATMRQKYRSSDGNGDNGKKILYFKQTGNKWFIADEVWSEK